ncbi:uncharacterized protein LOC127010998 isoform X2 [Drosophila biarmipes]|nr:uncharacterized protein LOC127010998 isoform X2 [Drosophila biarmipes]
MLMCSAFSYKSIFEGECITLIDVLVKSLETDPVASHISLLIFLVVNVVASVMLAIGTIKENHLLMLPWLINNGLFLFIWMALWISEYLDLVIDEKVPWILLFIIFVLHASITQVNCFLYYGILSLYKRTQALRHDISDVSGSNRAIL